MLKRKPSRHIGLLLKLFRKVASTFSGMEINQANLENLITCFLYAASEKEEEVKKQIRNFLYEQFLVLFDPQKDNSKLDGKKILTLGCRLLSFLYYDPVANENLVKAKIESVTKDEQGNYKIQLFLFFGPLNIPLLGETLNLTLDLPRFIRFYRIFYKIKGNKISSDRLTKKSTFLWLRICFDGVGGYRIVPIRKA